MFQIPPTVRTVNDVTASRAIGGGPYTNTTGNTLFVIVSVVHAVTVAGGHAYVAAAMNLVFALGGSGLYAGAPANLQTISTLVFVIPPDQQYQVVGSTTNGTNTLSSWIEAY